MEGLDLLCDDNLASALEAAQEYEFLVIDSVQAFRADEKQGWPVHQIRSRPLPCLSAAMGCRREPATSTSTSLAG